MGLRFADVPGGSCGSLCPRTLVLMNDWDKSPVSVVGAIARLCSCWCRCSHQRALTLQRHSRQLHQARATGGGGGGGLTGLFITLRVSLSQARQEFPNVTSDAF